MASVTRSDIARLVLRVGVGGVMAAHGTQKLFGWFGGGGLAGTAGHLESAGFRPGRLNAIVAGVTETAGGVLMAAGLATPSTGAAVTSTMAVAAATHAPQGFFAMKGSVVQGGVPLVGFGADETVEVLESAAERPLVQRAHRAGFPDRDLVAFAELGGAVSVEFQRLRERCCVGRSDRVVPGRRGGDLGDSAHPHRMVVPPGQQGLSGRRAQRGGVKPVEPQALSREAFECRGLARAAESTGGPEPGVVEQHHQHDGGARRWRSGVIGGYDGSGSFVVERRQANVLTIRDRQPQVPACRGPTGLTSPAGMASSNREPNEELPAFRRRISQCRVIAGIR